MNLRPITAAALAACSCIAFTAMPVMAAAAEATTGMATAAKAGSAASEPGTISNGYITYHEEPSAAFNHEVDGEFTLVAGERGAIAQLYYGVTYDGKNAAYYHEEGEEPQPDRFDNKTTQTTENGRIVTEARSTDGAIVVRTESAVGKGPYVTRKMQVTNTGDKALNKVRLLLTLNPDTLDWENEAGKVDTEASQVHLYNPDKTQWVGVAAKPKPAFLTADDVSSILSEDSGSDWSSASTSFDGNLGVQVGWELGPLEPGKSKSVDVTLANTESEADLRKALGGEAFPDK